MQTQLVRNTISLSTLNDFKENLDDTLKEAIQKTVDEFENKTNVAVACITVKITPTEYQNIIEVTSNLHLPL